VTSRTSKRPEPAPIATTIDVIAEPLESVVRVSIADPALASMTASEVSKALRVAMTSLEAPPPRVVRLRTRKRLARLGAEGVAGAIVVVRVTDANSRRLPELVDFARSAGALGVQLQWDGITPARSTVERHVFAVLERARSTRAGPPVVLSEDAEPALSLRMLLAHRARPNDPVEGKDDRR